MRNTETYQKAVDRIRDEMAKEAGNPGIQFLGGWLTGELEKRPELAETILDEQKSIKGAFGKIHDYASKHKTGNFAFVPPEKALEIVGEYYGIETQALGATQPHPSAAQTPSPQGKGKGNAGLDLDDLLGL